MNIIYINVKKILMMKFRDSYTRQAYIHILEQKLILYKQLLMIDSDSLLNIVY